MGSQTPFVLLAAALPAKQAHSKIKGTTNFILHPVRLLDNPHFLLQLLQAATRCYGAHEPCCRGSGLNRWMQGQKQRKHKSHERGSFWR
jgi:hypothetical protein